MMVMGSQHSRGTCESDINIIHAEENFVRARTVFHLPDEERDGRLLFLSLSLFPLSLSEAKKSLGLVRAHGR